MYFEMAKLNKKEKMGVIVKKRTLAYHCKITGKVGSQNLANTLISIYCVQTLSIIESKNTGWKSVFLAKQTILPYNYSKQSKYLN